MLSKYQVRELQNGGAFVLSDTKKVILRGIVAEALAKSTDPYRALLEADVVKNAAEFFDAIS